MIHISQLPENLLIPVHLQGLLTRLLPSQAPGVVLRGREQAETLIYEWVVGGSALVPVSVLSALVCSLSAGLSLEASDE